MKRKRHHQKASITAADQVTETPIDLTLSDDEEDDDRANGPRAVVKDEQPVVVLSDDEDGVMFVKDEPASFAGPSSSRHNGEPSRSNKAGSSTAITTTTTKSKTINDVLKDRKSISSSSSSTLPKSLPPLLLSTPLSVSKNTPCSLHYNILPTNLAERLYLKMLKESENWTRNKWYLNDKLVESNHKTCFYHSKIDGRFDDQWYMGRKLNDKLDNGGNVQGRHFINEMEEARLIIEDFVNQQLKDKSFNGKRFDFEYDGQWKANVAASNCYRGGAETVGYHADQLTYLGPYPTIASLSLGTTRVFRLRAVQSLQDISNSNASSSPPRTYDIELPHNSLCIMGAGCQEKYKHTIPPSRSIDVFKCKNDKGEIETHIERINITFRFYRPDFLPANTPICHCNVPCVLKADQKGKAAMNASNKVNNDDDGDDGRMRFFWMCFAGAQNEGKKCNYFKLLHMKGEKRGPCIGGHR